MNFDAILTHPALAGLRERAQWLPYAVYPDPVKPGKLAKRPLHYRTGVPCSVIDPANWTDCATAVATAKAWGAGFGAGRVFREGGDEWFLDLDSCRLADNTWSPLAQQLVGHVLRGAAVEVSASGNGIHAFGRGTVPPHSSRNLEHHAELYTAGRFCAITGDRLQGDSRAHITAGISWVVQTYFPPRVAASVEPVPNDGPRADYRGPASTPDGDEEIKRRAMQSRSASATFGTGASFADLWHADVSALARAYPPDTSGTEPFNRSSADAALFQHLAFWCGCHKARMVRLAQQSALKREKWERVDYIARTVEKAVTLQRDVLQDKPLLTIEGAVAPAAAGHHILADSPLDTARAFLAVVHPGGTLRRWQGGFYRWAAGAWREVSEDDVRASVYAFIDAQHLSHFKPTQSKVGNVMDALRAAAHLDSTTTPPCWLGGEPVAPAGELVACSNGLLHLPTRTLHAATPGLFNFNALPVQYSSAAPSPVAFLAFLAQVWPNDPEAIAVLQEMCGYLLTADTAQQKLFLIVGPKRSGKGTFARVLTALLGAENVASPTLSSLAERFGLEPLVGKLAAVLSDARLSGRTDQRVVAENLLRISGEDAVGIDRKGRSVMTVRLGVRVLMLTNEVPAIADASGAMASRFVVLRMTESFYGREEHGLTARLLAELPGILTWAVEGWHRLNQSGYFITPESSRDAAREIEDMGSPVAAFVRDVCTVDTTAEVDTDQLFAAWRTWCAREGIDRPGTKAHFGRDLRAAVQSIKVRQPRGVEGRQRVYAGIGLSRGTGWHGQLANAASIPSSLSPSAI